jgi:hypothetical protein
MKRSFAVTTLVLAAACGGGPSQSGSHGGPHGIAVLNSDYKSTVLSLVDPASASLAKDNCLNSGSTIPTLSLALSGDVSLPSAPVAGDELVLLDRTNSALDWIDPTSCTVRLQSSAGAFYANPHDLVSWSPHKAYVTRFEANPTPSAVAGANDEGNDVIIVDPQSGAITGRIDLAPYSAAGVQARPDRALLVNGKIYVTLANTSADFMTLGSGGLVVIDPVTDSVVAALDLAPYKSCSSLDYLEGGKRLIVGCSGDFNETLENQTAQSAIVIVDTSGATPAVARAIAGSATGNRPLASSVFAVAGEELVVAATYGVFGATPGDALWALSTRTGEATHLYDSEVGYQLSSITWLADEKKLLVSDASATRPVVHVFDVSKPSAITAIGTFDANPAAGLPPRALARY